MFHPTRGGTRGGQADFSWQDVKEDKVILLIIHPAMETNFLLCFC